MKDNQLTYILLIIASILLILNGIFAFDHTIAMILMSLLYNCRFNIIHCSFAITYKRKEALSNK